MTTSTATIMSFAEERGGHGYVLWDVQLIRALCAERDALKAENARLREEIVRARTRDLTPRMIWNQMTRSDGSET